MIHCNPSTPPFATICAAPGRSRSTTRCLPPSRRHCGGSVGNRRRCPSSNGRRKSGRIFRGCWWWKGRSRASRISAKAGAVEYLLHPKDHTTGLSYSLLPIVHAILSGLFTAEQARHHLDLIEQHLLGPDGARLFDRPLEYHGGLQRFFQRAESSSFFGREIGLMYTHAHLRYAEALWKHGDAAGFFRALCQAVPIGLDARVPAATRRQANCYYSSSDAAFADRYQAYAEYDRALAGEIPLDGGWRVYSSGAGIATALILRCFLGLRLEPSHLVIDPAIPKGLDGLRAELELGDMRFEITYRIAVHGCSVIALELNGRVLPFNRKLNPYRSGGAEVSMAALQENPTERLIRLTVWLA